MPLARSSAVEGSGMKCRSRIPKAGITPDAPMLVLMRIGVTSRTLPDSLFVELVERSRTVLEAGHGEGAYRRRSVSVL